MKYIVMILSVLLMASGGLGYWYYRDSQKIITTLNQNNARLETAVELNEQAIESLQQNYGLAQQQIEALNQENRQIRRNNQMLVDRFSDSDIGVAASAKPELVERLINRGTANAFRCLELLSGAELLERERNAKNGTEFNNECPWLFDTLVRP
jgi:cell division protein FtsB